MTAIASPAAKLKVRWACRRCGCRDGVARTTIPVNGWDEAAVRVLLDALRQSLVRIHARSGCIATHDDFVVSRYVPDDRSETVAGTV